MNTETSFVYGKAIEKYGKNAQLDMVIEEMSELTKEICKHKRGNINGEEILEEMADVYIMLEQLQMMLNIDFMDIMYKKTEKIERLKNRLEGEKNAQ